MSRKLKPPKNFRWVDVRVCAFCYFLVLDARGDAECTRPSGPDFSTGDLYFYERVCDYFKRRKEDK